jgi:uncharacterized protein with NAD-binding domain and iron-sulfur cluster
LEKLSSEVPEPDEDPAAGAGRPLRVVQLRRSEWAPWIERWKENEEKPGVGSRAPKSTWRFVRELVELAANAFRTSPYGERPKPGGYQPEMGPQLPTEGESPMTTLMRFGEALQTGVSIATATLGRMIEPGSALPRSLPDKRAIVDAMGAQARLVTAVEKAALGEKESTLVVDSLNAVRDWFWSEVKEIVADDTAGRRSWIVFDLAVSIAVGMVEDEVVQKGWNNIDDYDIKEWLRKHGANRITLQSGIIWGIYDFVFAYEKGDRDRPNLAAGSILRFMMQMVFDYKGSMCFSMDAGMGDVVFAPLYLVLKRRGVKFEFFHKVKHLGLDDSKTEIATIEMERQVRVHDHLKAPSWVESLGGLAPLEHGEYWPLMEVKGLPCWPSEPLYDQLEYGHHLEDGWRTFNLESHWSAWPGGEPRTLHKGEDFDRVVLGISLGGLPEICSELIEHDERELGWKAMVDNVATVPTHGMQLWTRPDLLGLGWMGASAVVDGYDWAMSTYADLTHLIERESWPKRLHPGSIGYFCGNLPDDEARPPPSDHDYPRRALAAYKESARTWLKHAIKPLWPLATLTDDPNQLNWDLLVDPQRRRGEQRLDSQFLRVNIDPCERYVLTLKGTNKYRLAAGDSRYKNLVLAGDWTRNPLNTGCVEAATMSGMLAARAICGHPGYVFGEENETASERELGTLHVDGDYDGVLAILAVPRGEIESRLPSGLSLGEQDLTPPGTHPLLVSVGTRRETGAPLLRQFFSQTYEECITLVPHVLRRKRGCNCGGGGPYLYAPKFYLSSLVVLAGSGLFWGFDADPARIDVQGADGDDRRSWHVRSRLGRRPILSVRSTARGATLPFEKLGADRVKVLDQLLSQPLLSFSLRGRGPALCAQLDWNIKHALIRPADVRVSFAHGFLGGGGEARLTSSAISTRTADRAREPGSFEIKHSRWQLSLPRLCCSCVVGDELDDDEDDDHHADSEAEG